MAALRESPAPRSFRASLPHPAYWIWRRLTSVRWAIGLILAAALFSAVGVIIPQVPPSQIDIPGGIEAHVEAQRGAFGWTTDPLAEFPWFYDARGGVFNLYQQYYWYALVALVAAAISVCTVSRAAPIWRTVRRPPRRVNAAYFERARHRCTRDLDAPAPPAERAAALTAVLTARRYRVERTAETDGAIELFADRFGWTQLATFVTHLALLLLLGAALVTKFGGEEYQFWVAEGESRTLFPAGDERPQVQIIVDDAIARFADDGQALDYRSAVRVAQSGAEAAAGEVTVNGPLHAAGYRVHQAAYWEHGAALRIYDHTTGQLVYSEAHFLDQQLVGPRIRIENSGAFVSEEVLGLQYSVAGEAPEGAAYTLVPLSAERSLALTLVPAEAGLQFWYRLLSIDADSSAAANLTLAQLGVGADLPWAPLVRLVGADGSVLIDGPISLDQELQEGAARFALLALPSGGRAAIGLREIDRPQGGGVEREFFYYSYDDDQIRGRLAAGQSAQLGGARLEYLGDAPDSALQGRLEAGGTRRVGAVDLTYLGAESVFYSILDEVPGAEGEVLLALERFGEARTAEVFDATGGEAVELAVGASAGGEAARPARLVLGLGGGTARIELDEGQDIAANGYRYEFAGPREFTGLTVRRDPGGIIFWIAVGLGVVGMSATFFAPRRRIWARVSGQRIALAGQAGHGVRFGPELRRIAAAAGGSAPEAQPSPRRPLRGRFSADYSGSTQDEDR